jgi:hypothetical protein
MSSWQAARLSHANCFEKQRAHGEADEDHDRNRFFVGPPGPEFETRMVSTMRGPRGDDCAGKHRRDLEP